MRRLTLVWSVILLSLALSVTIVPAAHAAFPGGNGEIAFSRATTVSTTSGSSAPASPARTTSRTRRTASRGSRTTTPPAHGSPTRAAARATFSNCDIWSMDADGANEDRLTFTPGVQETWPSWSPDGHADRVHIRRQGPSQDIWVMDADGEQPDPTHVHGRVRRVPGMVARRDEDRVHERPGGPRRHLGDRRRRLQPHAAHGRHAGGRAARLVAERREDHVLPQRQHLEDERSNGNHEVQLTFAHGREFAPSFSPNGKRIAFNRSSQDGNRGSNIWIIKADGTGAVHRTFSEFDFFPDWQPI